MNTPGNPQPMPELAVIGWPLRLTFSPDMQAAALRKAGLNWRYEAIPVAPETLPVFLSSAASTMRGFNVTIPHKGTVKMACSRVDDLANSSGAVNTVVCDSSRGRPRLEGHNTDGPGLLKALELRAGFEPPGSSVLVLGAGGAAAGCVAALARRGSSTITIANRTAPRAASLIDRMQALITSTTWSFSLLDEEIDRQAVARHARRDFDLVINCLPEEPSSHLGGLLESVFRRGSVFCDMCYSYGPTNLLSLAGSTGYRVVPGLEVLLWQGVYAFEVFTRESAPVDAMRDGLKGVAGGWWLQC
ncbi:MAG: hypothetical protein HPY55_10885 [Firmicutes bacterium]|nr:hypothetical protein [Bacillota bacterium]